MRKGAAEWIGGWGLRTGLGPRIHRIEVDEFAMVFGRPAWSRSPSSPRCSRARAEAAGVYRAVILHFHPCSSRPPIRKGIVLAHLVERGDEPWRSGWCRAAARDDAGANFSVLVAQAAAVSATNGSCRDKYGLGQFAAAGKGVPAHTGMCECSPPRSTRSRAPPVWARFLRRHRVVGEECGRSRNACADPFSMSRRQ